MNADCTYYTEHNTYVIRGINYCKAYTYYCKPALLASSLYDRCMQYIRIYTSIYIVEIHIRMYSFP